jgi:hypothetical protein
MKCAVSMSSGAIIYIPSIIKIGLGIQNLIGEDGQKHRQHGDFISILVYFFKIRNVG